MGGYFQLHAKLKSHPTLTPLVVLNTALKVAE